ncbi:MAG: histidine--tRNA ligase [Candidatus Omnitrophota bacterium]
MIIKSPRGTKDILPEEVGLYQEIEGSVSRIFNLYAYKEIRTPLFEEAQLFVRSLGKASEVVQKQMFSVVSKGDASLVLRPEATASIIRAYLEHGLYQKSGFNKFYYIGPMFRAERPQKGRLRQFNHIGCEALGSTSPYLDSEVISLCLNILEGLGINDYKLFINNLGCKNDTKNFSEVLREKLKPRLNHLCALCKDRFKRNVLRILDCKNKSCREIIGELDLGPEYLCQDCKTHFEKVKEALQLQKIQYLISPHLVRGLDYYTRTVFEITHHNLGSQDAVAAGGRYDNLAEELGGICVPAVGFAIGLERLILSLGADKKKKISRPDKLDTYIVSIGQNCYNQAFVILNNLRRRGISAEIDYEAKSLKAQMRAADKLKTDFVILLGDEEVSQNLVTLKDMRFGEQSKISLEELYKKLEKR